MDISKAKVSIYSRLRDKKFREREGLFLVQGLKAVRDTLGKFSIEAIIIRKGECCPFDLPPSTPLLEAKENELRKISTLDNLPDVIAVYRIPQHDFSLFAEKGKWTLVLDGVQDPGNLGTIVRLAHWFGVKDIFCSRETVDLYNPKVVQSTMGSIAAVRVSYCKLEDLFEKNPDTPVYGMMLKGTNIFEAEGLKPGFIVMGSEGHGHSLLTASKITLGLTIPPSNPLSHPDSLNVAVATAITLSRLIQ